MFIAYQQWWDRHVWVGFLLVALSILGSYWSYWRYCRRIDAIQEQMQKRKTLIPVRIETEYDKGDPSKRSVLFEGFISRPDTKR